MIKTNIRAAGVAAAILAVGGSAVPAPAGSASAGHPPNTSGFPIDLGPAPNGLPQSCTFANNDASFVTVGGNAVSHETTNKNGDWGGLTFEGTAIFEETPYDGFNTTTGAPIDDGPSVPLYVGHLTYWNGGGNNAGGQTEGGFTADFHGTALVGTGTIDIHVTAHGTTNNAGTPTANVANVSVSCS